jgi:hypothetical protein
MTVIKIVPMPGRDGSGNNGGISSVEPLYLNDQNNDLLLSISKTGTGTTRIETPQDDLSLRSARDITLYAGSDGPGEVYIGWGDAVYTPDSPNRVATVGYVDEATGASSVKYNLWRYPTENAIAIMPTTDNESISLKSSDAAAIRWHVRNNGSSAAGYGQLHPTSAEIVPGDGVYAVTFTFPEENAIPTTTEHTYYVVAPNSPNFDGAFFPQAATTTTITFNYDFDPGVFDPTDSYINQPSVYSQFEVDEYGAHIKLANWTDGQGATYSQTWDFTKEGAIHFPYGPSNQRTGYGDVLKFASSFDQAIITGAPATESNPNANRLIVAGQDGYVGTAGEGGDVYLWAGRGGDTNGNGGDIKIDGGNGIGTGQGGYVKHRGGYSDNGTGGFVWIEGGSSGTGYGGPIDIRAGSVYGGNNTDGGSINIISGASNSSGKGGDIALTSQTGGAVILNGDGGEFLNSKSDPNNQIATVGQLPSGATGSFVSQDGKTITVTNGIITAIDLI